MAFPTATNNTLSLNPWGSFDFDSDNVQQQIVSTLSHIFHNLSYYQSFYLYNGSLSDLTNYSLSSPFDSAQEAIYDMRNLTFNMLSDTSPSFLTNLEYAQVLGTIFYVGTLVQYLATFVSTLVGGWVLNRATLKNEIVTDILETVISLLIILPALPAIIVFFLGIMGARTLATIYLRLAYPDGKYNLLNAVDGFWAYETFASCSTCLGLYIIEGKCDLATIRERLKKTVESDIVDGKMNRKLTSVIGFSCWETIPMEEMDMVKYVRVVDNGNDKVMGEQDVFQAMKIMQDKPIENSAPWEVDVIPHFAYKSESTTSTGGDNEEDKYYAVIYRIHHSIMDGISTGNILHSVMADKPFKFSLDPTHPFRHRNPSPWETGLLFFLGFISMPRVALRNLFLVDNYQNKYCLPGPQLTGPKTLSWSRPIRMDALKGIKNHTETSVYSVLLSCLGGAFRKLCITNGTSIDVENFHVMSPIALLPYPDRKPRNRFTGVIVPTNVGDQKNVSPVERLQKNFGNLKALGASSATFLAIANWYYPAVIGILPLFLHKPLSLLIHLKMSLSNVPGPAEDVFIYEGGKIVDIGIWLPIKYSLGFGMGLFSYKDKVRATVIGDKAYFKNEGDIDFITKAFEDELSLLGEEIGIKDVFMSE